MIGDVLSTDEWIQKIWCAYTMEYDAAVRKNERVLSAATWME